MEKLRLDRRPEARAFSVETLLQHVRDGRIRIPEFQRPLRWRASHVIDLLDSVYRGFPVGDLLLFKRAAGAGVVHVGPVDVRAPAVPDAYFVVDGQQRITALAGAMLHPEHRPTGDIYAVWFDLEQDRFVVTHGAEPPAHWIPLNVVGDSFALLTWLNEWPFRGQRPDLVQQAIALGKALREYQIPAYIVGDASEDAIRLIFKRLNTSGVAMQESEIFGALFHGDHAQPIESACARLQTATGFGEVPAYWFLRCLRVVEGLHVGTDLTEEQVLALDPLAIERAENALLRAIRFLVDDAGIIHFKLMPHQPILVVLARFFHLHPRPAERTRALLSRWHWRSALSQMHDVMTDDELVGADEFTSVERLLGDITPNYFFPQVSMYWETRESAPVRLAAIALVHLGPRDPETGDALGSEEIRALIERGSVLDAFIDVQGWVQSTIVRRVLVSSHDKMKKLPCASLAVLESHGLDQEAADALGRGDMATFTARRAPILDRWFQRFFTARLGADDGDRPPIAELVRRVDKALTAA
jgi:Protein of unknown function DUF262